MKKLTWGASEIITIYFLAAVRKQNTTFPQFFIHNTHKNWLQPPCSYFYECFGFKLSDFDRTIPKDRIGCRL